MMGRHETGWNGLVRAVSGNQQCRVLPSTIFELNGLHWPYCLRAAKVMCRTRQFIERLEQML